MDLGITIPCLNSVKFLKTTLQEIIILKDLGCSINAVDSGSIDGTLELLYEYKINTLYYPPGNMYKAVNFGLSALDTEWYTYINSDDILHAQNTIDFFTLNAEEIENSDLFCGSVNYINELGDTICTRKLFNKSFVRLAVLNQQPILAQPGTFFRKSLFDRLGGFDTNFRFSGDFDFFIRAFKSESRLFIDPKFDLASFRSHANQFSVKESKKMLDETNRIYKKNKLKSRPLVASFLRLVLFLMNIKSWKF